MHSRTRNFVVLTIVISAIYPVASVAQQPQRLHDFIRQTVDLHPAVKAAEKIVSKANAERLAAGKFPHNPEVEVGYERAGERTRELGLSQTLDIWGRQNVLATVADHAVVKSKAEFELLKIDLIEGLLLSLGKTRKQSDRLDLAKKRLLLSTQFLDFTKRSVAAGDSGQDDLLTAKINHSNAELQVAGTERDLAEARSSLIALVGEDRRDWPVLPIIDLGKRANVASDLEGTPELQLARASLAASKAGIVLADKSRLPNPTVGFRIGDEGESTLYGLSFSIPIPIWNQGKAEKLAASEDAAASEFLVGDTRRRLHARLITAERNFRAGATVITKWRSNTAPALRDQEQLIQRLVEAREINSLQYLQQLDQLIGTEELGIELEEALWRAWVIRLRAGAQLRTWVEELR